MATIQIRIQKNDYDNNPPADALNSGVDFFSILNTNALPGVPFQHPIERKFRFTASEIRTDVVDEVIPHKLTFEFINNVIGTLVDSEPGGNITSAVFFQHGDDRTTNGAVGPLLNLATLEGAATFAFDLPNYVDTIGAFHGKDGNDIFVTGLPDPTSNVIPPPNIPISSFAREYVGVSPGPYTHDENSKAGELRLMIEMEVDGEYVVMGNKKVSFITIAALPAPSPTAGIDFENYIVNDIPTPFNDTDAFAVLLSAESVEAFTNLANGEPVGFVGMSDLISGYVDLSDPENVDCEAAAIAMVADMVSSGMPFPGFPDGLGPPPPPSVPSLIPPKLDKIIKGVTDALDTVAKAAGAPAAIPQIIEKIQRDICEIINSILAVAELQNAQHIKIKIPLRPDLLGGTSAATPNKEIEIAVCVRGGAIGQVLDCVTGEMVQALTADSPEEFSLADRIEQITLMDATQIEKQLDKAIADGKVGALSPNQKAKTVRQFGALVANVGNTPKCYIDDPSPAFDLISDWASFSGNVDIYDFWENTVKADTNLMEGHLDLILCFLAKGHQALVDEVRDYLLNQIPPLDLSVASIANFSKELWASFFYPCIPLCIPGKNIETRVNRLLQNAAIVTAKHLVNPYDLLPLPLAMRDKFVLFLTDLTGETNTVFLEGFETALIEPLGFTYPAPDADIPGIINTTTNWTSVQWKTFFTATCVNDNLIPEAFSPSMSEDRFADFCIRIQEVKDNPPTPFNFTNALDALASDGPNGTPHQPLVDAVNNSPYFAPYTNPLVDLLDKDKSIWRSLFFPQANEALCPPGIDPTLDEDRILIFIDHAQEISQQISAGTLTPYNIALDALVVDNTEPVRTDIDTWINTILIPNGVFSSPMDALENLSASDWQSFFNDPSLFISGVFPALTNNASIEDCYTAFLERYNVVVDDINTPGGVFTGIPPYIDVLTALTSPLNPVSGEINPFGPGHPALIAAINPDVAANVPNFLTIPPVDWFNLFFPSTDLTLFPPYTQPNDINDIVEGVLGHIGKCFPLPPHDCPIPDPVIPAPPSFDCLIDDCITDAVNAGSLVFGSIVAADLDLIPDLDECCKKAILTIDELFRITDVTPPTPGALRFSLMEALYARGFTSINSILELSSPDFKTALIGTIAYDFADDIYVLAGGTVGPVVPSTSNFVPVNSNGDLRNCIPFPHTSILGPASYLSELLVLDETSNCSTPFPVIPTITLSDLINNRRGTIGSSLNTAKNNLEVPIPLIDIVNESLEELVANGTTTGVIYNTSETEVKGLFFETHPPEKILCAIPEHSGPAFSADASIRATQDTAYNNLRTASGIGLPYDRSADILECYLGELQQDNNISSGTSLFDLRRRFTHDIHEHFSGTNPINFKTHLWRLPVTLELAIAYLGINQDEYELIFEGGAGAATPRQLYGFPSSGPFTSVAKKLDQFLNRTGLCYDDFILLWKSEFVLFDDVGGSGFPEIEPKDLSPFEIDFSTGSDTDNLRKLIVGIRFWEKLKNLANANYSFDDIRDFDKVFEMFDSSLVQNPDFIRQFVSFQMLRDIFDLELRDANAPLIGTGADRMHLLALWVGPTHSNWDWAVNHLLDKIEAYAEQEHKCQLRPDLKKILKRNLDKLSILAGFNPTDSTATWFAHPTHTIRFAEVLSKIYASNFDVDEICFLFSDEHIGGEDPFVLQSEIEANKSVFDFPEETDFSLIKLREQLLAVEAEVIKSEDWKNWSWEKIKTKFIREYCFDETMSVVKLDDFKNHFFAGIDNKDCYCPPVSASSTKFCVPLLEVNTSPIMWNEPPTGPFTYDVTEGELCFSIPLSNQAVIEKIYTDKLNLQEKRAIRDLYFLPRKELAQFGFLFPNQLQAIEYLIQEEDIKKRWEYFQKAFAVFCQRCEVIASFMADHIASNDPKSTFEEGKEVMWTILKNLFADENNATAALSWENSITGEVPNVLWNPLPHAGAFAAINGLVGTGLLAEYFSLNERNEFTYDGNGNIDASIHHLLWRDVRGPLSAFGEINNNTNTPVSSIIPSIEFDDTTLQCVTICNGFALENSDGDILGGAQPYGVRWQGRLLIKEKGDYTFYAGEPTAEGEAPIYDENSLPKWQITLRRGQKTWELLDKGMTNEHIPCDCSPTVCLSPGIYELVIDYINPVPDFNIKEEVCPQTTGFQLKYTGPDTEDNLNTIPFECLFRDCKNETLGNGVEIYNYDGTTTTYSPMIGEAADYLNMFYTSTLRDIRRTYQRAFKAGVFSNRFQLSTRATTRNNSELSYLLNNSEDFEGISFVGPVSHLADFDFNLLPVKDFFKTENLVFDHRYDPSVERTQALFDWWEKIFDYKALQASVSNSTNDPLWELFLYEKDEQNAAAQPEANRLERYMGVNLRSVNNDSVLTFASAPPITHGDLINEEWAIRIWQAAQAVESYTSNLSPENAITNFSPMAWAAGNDLDKLAEFVCQTLIEDCNPPQYDALEKINNKLRLNARQALVQYLIQDNRVALPWEYVSGTIEYATEAKHLSELLLIDVEAGICQKASRIEEATTAVQNYMRRVRMGLEYPTMSTPIPFNASLDFIHLWDKHFTTFNIWKKCKMREVFNENWLEYDKLKKAKKTEAFQFLEDRLRRQTLTVPITKELPNPTPVNNVGGRLLQHQEPAITQVLVASPREGFDQIATPEVHGRSSWLTSITESDLSTKPPKVPYWIDAAIRLGKKFVRVAAAGQPLNRLYCPPIEGDCCETCHEPHQPLVDEYYFWLVDSKFFQAIQQNADWNWHSDADLPTLLSWTAENKVLLAWTKIHNGEFQQLRFSDEGVHVVDSDLAEIEFLGRTADTLQIKVQGGIIPVGYPNTPEPGFRYDLVTDSAVVLPQLTNPLSGYLDIGGLSAFPSFAYFVPGATVMPPSLFSSAITVANNLRSHCRFEVALKVYEQVYNPLLNNNEATWDNAGNTAAINENKTILLHYLETLLEWGDALMKQHSPEAFQQSRLVYDTACKIMGQCPVSIMEESSATGTIESFAFDDDRIVNPRLLNLFENIEDRLDLIRTCQNSSRYKNGTPNKDMLYFGNSPIRCGWETDMDICADELESCLPHSPYRFQFLLQKAQEFAGEVTSLGGALLSAYEKGDGEYLASLRGYHEKQLLELALEVRKDQWRASDWDVQGLYKTKEMAQIRLAYNQELYSGGLNGGESDYVSYTQLSLTELILSKAIEIGAQILRGIPDVLAGLPQMHMPLGSKMAGFVSTISQVFSTMSQYHGTYAGLRNTEGGWDRREREWLHQIELITVEIQQIERQILGSERRRDVALRELNNQVQQIENSKEVFDYMKDKFSNHELYLWMQKETAALHAQMYELALLLARQAERAYNYERGFTTKKFIDGNMLWDNLHEGLLAGERLQHSLRRMEKTYYDENIREYELTKHISLRQHFPLEFLMLKETGCCTIQIPEWMFDMDYPGHYMRRIKNMSLSIPCVVGPYTGVHSRLTLLSARTRIKPTLNKNADDSCVDGDINNGYPALPDDSRWVHQFISSEAIATSSGQNDSGMFELNFNDDRYLPFEYAGAISCWRVELPRENNYFDMDSLGDVIMHLNYTAREGGELLRQAAQEITNEFSPGNGKRLIDVKHELPEEWHQFMNCKEDDTNKELKMKFSQSMFPYLPCDKKISINCIDLVMEVSDEFQQEQFNIDFIPNIKVCSNLNSDSKSPDFTINCIAASDWKDDCDFKNLYQGKIDVDKAGIILNGNKKEIGSLSVPKDVEGISNLYLIIKYGVLKKK